VGALATVIALPWRRRRRERSSHGAMRTDRRRAA